MFTYKYTGTGIISFTIEDKTYTVAYNHAVLKDTIELPIKININGLELIEEEQKRKKSKKSEGE